MSRVLHKELNNCSDCPYFEIDNGAYSVMCNLSNKGYAIEDILKGVDLVEDLELLCARALFKQCPLPEKVDESMTYIDKKYYDKFPKKQLDELEKEIKEEVEDILKTTKVAVVTAFQCSVKDILNDLEEGEWTDIDNIKDLAFELLGE